MNNFYIREIQIYKRVVLLNLNKNKETCSEIIIPMKGMAESFNVSVATAIILSEAQRQRQEAGMYDHSRIDGGIYQTKLFQWCQPIVTQFCDRHGVPYPELDAEGEIIDAPGWYARIREQGLAL